METLRYAPKALFPLDNVSDISGYGTTLNVTGTSAYGLSLASNATGSYRASTTTYVSPAGLHNVIGGTGRELHSFSLSAVLYPVITTTAARVQIASHAGIYDGLSLNGNVITFGTHYANTGEASCSYDLGAPRRADVVGVHSREKNSLYVDGVLVAEVDISAIQQADTFATQVANNWVIGYSENANKTLLNNVGFFSQALQSEQVSAIYAANAHRAEGSVPKTFGGDDIFVSSIVRPCYLNLEWLTDDDWNNGIKSRVAVENDQLLPQMIDGLSVVGVWENSVDLYTGESPVPINSINLDWNGKGELVQASIDGTNWVTVNKRENLSNISTGFNPLDKVLLIRITFTAGLTDAFVDSMRVTGYTNSTGITNNRVITYTNPATPMNEYDPFLLREDWGVRMRGAGRIVIGPDGSDTPPTVRTIEVWAKLHSGSSYFVPTSVTGFTNGKTLTNPLQGEWTVIHTTYATSQGATIELGNDIQIGKVATYPTVLTQAQVDILIANYTGVYTTKVDGTGNIAIAEPAVSTVIYAYDWTIYSA